MKGSAVSGGDGVISVYGQYVGNSGGCGDGHWLSGNSSAQWQVFFLVLLVSLHPLTRLWPSGRAGLVADDLAMKQFALGREPKEVRDSGLISSDVLDTLPITIPHIEAIGHRLLTALAVGFAL